MYGHDTISVVYGMMAYCAMLTGEDLSRYLNNINKQKNKSVGLRQA